MRETDEIVFLPGNFGKDCLGKEKNSTKYCKFCDFSQCCSASTYPKNCQSCQIKNCPRKELQNITY